MKDIQNKEDIKLLIDSFYKRVLADDLIGRFFTQVIEFDWDKHIAVMYNFWETILFDKVTYKGNPMIKHIELNKKASITPEHFNRWLTHWETTIAENFKGEKAEQAIQRAHQIAALMQFKINQNK